MTSASRLDIPVQLLRLSAPMIAATMSRTVMGFVDFAMIKPLGTEAQAAISPGVLVLFTVISFGMGTVSMVNTFVSQALGRGEPRECAAFTWQGIYLSILFGVLVLPGWYGVEPLFALIGHEPAVQRLECDYTKIGVFGVAPALAAFALGGFFSGIHRPTIPLVAALVGNVFNVAANYALIYGHWGCPRMGVAGASLATVLASLVNAAILLGWMLLPRYDRGYQTRTSWPLDPSRLGRLCWFGMPAGVHFAADITTWTIFTNFFVGRFGKEQLAANNIAIQLLHLSFMPAVGVGQALSVMVGKNIGEGQLDRARSAVRWALLFTLIYMTTMGLIMAVWRYPLVGLLNSEEQVLLWGGRVMIFCALFQVFDAMSITYAHALRGAGDTHWCAGAALACAVLVLMGGSTLAVIYVPHWGSAGPWTACTVYATALGLVFASRYRWGPWARIALFRKDGEPALAP